MIGHSATMRAVYRNVRLVAARNTTVLITGPTGSGKELVARALHELSPQSHRKFRSGELCRYSRSFAGK